MRRRAPRTVDPDDPCRRRRDRLAAVSSPIRRSGSRRPSNCRRRLDRLDDNGKPLPIMRRLTWREDGARRSVLVLLLLAGTYYTGTVDFRAADRARAGVGRDCRFREHHRRPDVDRTLEPMLKRALEGAGFISAYDRVGIRGSLGVRPPDRSTRPQRATRGEAGLGVSSCRARSALRAAATSSRSRPSRPLPAP